MIPLRSKLGGVAAVVLLLAITALVYLPGLRGPLLLDDEGTVRPLLQSIDAANWRQTAGAFLFSDTGPGGRPVAMLSLIVTIVAHGPDPVWLKWHNVLLHLLCGMLLLAWMLQVERALPVAQRLPRRMAWWLAAWWLMHPMQVGTVLYAVQRMTLLSTLFVLLGLLAYVHGRLHLRQGQRSGWLWLLVTLLVCLPLAFFSKESGILLLPLCVVQEWVLFGAPRGDCAPHLSAQRLLWRLYGWGLALPTLILCTAGLPRVLAWVQRGYVYRPFTLGQRLLTEPRVLLMYLQEVLWPAPSVLAFYHDDVQASHGLLQPPGTVLALLMVAALFAGAVVLRRRLPLFSLGVLVFLVGHSLEGSVIPLELMFEHRNYLPSIGILLAMVSLPWAAWLPPRVKASFHAGAGRMWLAPLLRILQVRRVWPMALLVLLGALTLQRAYVWGAADRLFPALYAANPQSPRLSALFATSYANAGQFAQAQGFLEGQSGGGAMLQSLDIDCRARNPLEPLRLAVVAGQLPGIVRSYEAQQLVLLANDALEQRCGLPLDWTLTLLDRAVRQNVAQASDQALLQVYRAHLLHALKRTAEAQLALAAARQLRPADPLPILLSAEWWLEQDKVPEAQAQYRAACQQALPPPLAWQDDCKQLGQRLKDLPQ